MTIVHCNKCNLDFKSTPKKCPGADSTKRRLGCAFAKAVPVEDTENVPRNDTNTEHDGGSGESTGNADEAA